MVNDKLQLLMVGLPNRFAVDVRYCTIPDVD